MQVPSEQALRVEIIRPPLQVQELQRSGQVQEVPSSCTPVESEQEVGVVVGQESHCQAQTPVVGERSQAPGPLKLTPSGHNTLGAPGAGPQSREEQVVLPPEEAEGKQAIRVERMFPPSVQLHVLQPSGQSHVEPGA